MQRGPDFDIRVGKLEFRRHHAGYGERLSGDRNGAADYRGVGVEAAPPKPIAEHRGPLIGFQQSSTQTGAGSQDLEERTPGPETHDLLGFAGSGYGDKVLDVRD